MLAKMQNIVSCQQPAGPDCSPIQIVSDANGWVARGSGPIGQGHSVTFSQPLDSNTSDGNICSSYEIDSGYWIAICSHAKYMAIQARNNKLYLEYIMLSGDGGNSLDLTRRITENGFTGPHGHFDVSFGQGRYDSKTHISTLAPDLDSFFADLPACQYFKPFLDYMDTATTQPLTISSPVPFDLSLNDRRGLAKTCLAVAAACACAAGIPICAAASAVAGLQSVLIDRGRYDKLLSDDQGGGGPGVSGTGSSGGDGGGGGGEGEPPNKIRKE